MIHYIEAHARREFDAAIEYYDMKSEPEEVIQQTITTGEETKTIEKALEHAAEMRHRLEGRHHSDSTQGVVEDRKR